MPTEPTPGSDFTSLYHRTVGPLRRYLSRILGSSGDAQDIAHDAYLRLYPRHGKSTVTNPEGLLYTTARNLAINQLRRRAVSPFAAAALDLDTAPATSPSIPQQVIARQELDLLEAAITELPAGCRHVLLLRKVENLSHAAIASRLGITVSTVEKQYARALRLLKATLATRLTAHDRADNSTPSPEAQP